MTYALNPSIREIKEVRSLSLRTVWFAQQIPGHPGLHTETLSWEREKERQRESLFSLTTLRSHISEGNQGRNSRQEPSGRNQNRVLRGCCFLTCFPWLVHLLSHYNPKSPEVGGTTHNSLYPFPLTSPPQKFHKLVSKVSLKRVITQLSLPLPTAV